MPTESNKIEEELNELDILVERFKDGVDRCDISSIATNSRTLRSRVKSLNSNINVMTEKQKDMLADLDIESTKQFERLSKGRCACSMVKNI
jgi:hypothetical protein